MKLVLLANVFGTRISEETIIINPLLLYICTNKKLVYGVDI